MPTIPVYDLKKKKVGTVDLNDKIFAADVSEDLMADAVRAHMAWRYRIKPANTMTRSEVHGTTQKVYRQKGTGQARHGAETAPIFVGGGKAHGPRPRVISRKMNRNVARKALISALSLLQKQDRLFVIDKLQLDKHSSKAVATGIKGGLGLTKALVVNPADETPEKVFNRSTKNIRDVKVLRPEGLNVFDIMKYQHLVLSEKAVKKLTERLSDD